MRKKPLQPPTTMSSMVCSLNNSQTVHKLCFYHRGKGEEATETGKPIFWSLSQHRWSGNILTIHPIVGHSRFRRLLQPCEDYLNMSDEEKEPRILADPSFPGCICHTLARATHTGHSWSWNEINHLLSEGSSLGFL